MSWLEKLLPPKINPTDPSERRSVPEGLWIKCPSCETVLYKNDLEAKCERVSQVRTSPPHRCPRPPGRLPRRRRSLRAGPGSAAHRPPEVQGQPQVPRASEAGHGSHRRDRCPDRDGRLGAQRSADRSVLRVRLHGRLDGLRGGRALCARCGSSRGPEGAFRVLHRHRRARACRKAC